MDIPEPKLPPKCGVCHHEQRFAIQKAIDDGLGLEEISKTYNIEKYILLNHNKVGHRADLLSWGYADYNIRKNAQKYNEINNKTICEMAKKTLEAAKQLNPSDIKPGDIIKFSEFISKMTGELVDKSEITVKKDFGTVIREFLDERDEVKIVPEMEVKN